MILPHARHAFAYVYTHARARARGQRIWKAVGQRQTTATWFVISYHMWHLNLRSNSHSCRKNNAFTWALERLSFLSAIIYWIWSSGPGFLRGRKRQINVAHGADMGCADKFDERRSCGTRIATRMRWVIGQTLVKLVILNRWTGVLFEYERRLETRRWELILIYEGTIDGYRAIQSNSRLRGEHGICALVD